MSTGPAPLIRHVSRRELTQNRYIWLATGWMYVAFLVATVAMVMLVSGFSPRRMQGMAILLLVTAIIHLRAHPPRMDSLANHLVLVTAWLFTGIAFWAYQPGGGVALGAMLFIGPLTAVRLDDRRQIAAHILAANTLAIVVGLASGVDHATQIAIAMMTLASAVLCFSCVVVLEAAEAQGDELERLVRRDPLTGVGNRRLLDERLVDEVTRHERMQRPLSLIALDLNGFKAVNDALGHAAGDELLRDVAAALERVAAQGETIVRQGGDEFCLVLPETSPAHAERTANAIRAALATIDVRTGIGIASYPDDAVDAHVLLHVADERLRANKTPTARRTPAPRPGVQPDQADGPGRMVR